MYLPDGRRITGDAALLPEDLNRGFSEAEIAYIATAGLAAWDACKGGIYYRYIWPCWRLARNYNKPERWEIWQDEREHPAPMGRASYIQKAKKENRLARSACTQLSLFGRTYQELFPATAEKISEPCWKSLPAWNSQTLLFLDLRGGADGAKPEQSPERDGALLGDSSTLNIGESPSVENESLLSQILEANAPLKYYLSERACQGILTRASRRGKALPDLLKTALLEMIEWWQRGGGTQPIP